MIRQIRGNTAFLPQTFNRDTTFEVTSGNA
jgi:hypothetical protein